MSSEHFGQLAWQFKRMSGSCGLKVQAALLADEAASLLDGSSLDLFPPFENSRAFKANKPEECVPMSGKIAR
jgi:hypothetical protein